MSVILLCGLNGSGKTSLGKALAKELGFSFLNDEEYWFLESRPFSKSRTEEEAISYIKDYVSIHKNVVLTSTRGNLGNEINGMYDFVVYLSAPKELRMARIKKRDRERFGNPVNQKEFWAKVEKRTPEKIERWLQTLSCPVLRLDGTKPIDENVEFLKRLPCVKGAVTK